MDKDKPLTEEFKENSDQLSQEIAKARQEAKLATKITESNMAGALVYGGPMSQKWKKCLEWVRQDVKVNQKSEVKFEVFEAGAPFGWAFFFHPERGWLKYDLTEMFGSIKRNSEVSHEANTDPSST